MILLLLLGPRLRVDDGGYPIYLRVPDLIPISRFVGTLVADTPA